MGYIHLFVWVEGHDVFVEEKFIHILIEKIEEQLFEYPWLQLAIRNLKSNEAKRN